MSKTTPLIKDNVLQFYDIWEEKTTELLSLTNVNDWEHWQQFLEGEKSFRYVFTNEQGFSFSFSARKEMRPSFGDKTNLQPVWVAYKTVDKKRRKRYLGKKENLTADKLKATALDINQGRFAS